MINLCDSNKYFTDSILTGAAKRIPRAVEDIEIIGNVLHDETISFPTISGQCGINEIASFKISFYSRSHQLEIIGNGPSNTENRRQPTGTDLTNIQEKDPLRFNHGWYTINPAFTIGTILTNGNIKLNNLGFNNSRTDCFDLLSENSIIANNTLSLNKITLTSNSRAYDSQFTSNIFLADAGTKMDNMNIVSQITKLNGGSYLYCQFSSADIYFYNYVKIIDSSIKNTIFCTGNTPQFLRSNIECDTFEPKLAFVSGSTISVGDTAKPDGANFIDSTLKTWKLTNIDTLYLLNSSLSAEDAYGSSINNSGVVLLQFAEKIKLDNFAKTTINELVKPRNTFDVSTINNEDRGVITIINSGYFSNGSNRSIINGNIVEVDTLFINTSSGQILSKVCNLYNLAVNYGTISTCNLFNSGNNASTSGGISIANFYHTSTNNGVVKVGNFYDISQNFNTGIQQATFYSGSINNANFSNSLSSLTFRDFSQNKGNIYNAQFYNSGSHKEGSCYSSNFYDYSQCTSGPLNKVNFYNESKHIGTNTDVSGVNFFHDSKFVSLNISVDSGSLHLYDNASGNIIEISVPTGLNCTINDNSIVDYINGSVYDNSSIKVNGNASVALSSGQLTFYFNNKSVCGSSASTIILNDFAVATGSSYANITGYGSSQIINNTVNIHSLVLNNNSQCLSRTTSIAKAELYDQSKFYGNSITSGLVDGEAKLMTQAGFTATNLLFTNNAQSNIAINADTIIFSGRCLNGPSGTLTALKIIFDNSSQNGGPSNGTTLFKNNSINSYRQTRSTSSQPYYFIESFNRGSGNNIMHFGSGAINYGYVVNGLFYENSANLGIVKNGIFHPSVIQTGTVLENGIISGISWSDPF